jgi:hypothetical protein
MDSAVSAAEQAIQEINPKGYIRHIWHIYLTGGVHEVDLSAVQNRSLDWIERCQAALGFGPDNRWSRLQLQVDIIPLFSDPLYKYSALK